MRRLLAGLLLSVACLWGFGCGRTPTVENSTPSTTAENGAEMVLVSLSVPNMT